MKLDKRACRHAANVPLHISLNAGVLYTERVKYLVTAAVKLLGGHRVLAVYFYECERLKANDRMPKWVVFQGKDTFATLERDAEGNVKWRDAMVQHLTDYYMGDFLQSCVFYKKAGCHTIARYIGAKSDPTKVLWELNWYQQDIRDQQTKIRRYKRDTVVLNKMSSVPQTPANLKRWADAVVCLSAKAAVKRCMDMGDILITTFTVRNAVIAALPAERSLSVCRASELPVPASSVGFALPAMSK